MQCSKLTKSSGCLVANNWRNIVTRCKFLVASFYNVNDAAQGLWYFTRSWSHEIQVNPWNSRKHAKYRNIWYVRYVSVQHIWNLSQQIYLETSSLKHGNNVPKLPGKDYVAKNWALSHDVKGFAIWFISGAYCCWKSKWWPLVYGYPTFHIWHLSMDAKL